MKEIVISSLHTKICRCCTTIPCVPDALFKPAATRTHTPCGTFLALPLPCLPPAIGS
jgi:hypothetical protein